MLKQRPRHVRATERWLPGTLTVLLVSAGAALGLAGCGNSDDEEVAAPIAKKAPPPPPRVIVPTVTPVSALMATHGIDERIEMPEQFAPSTDASRIAVLKFFDAMAKGDSTGLGGMLSSTDQDELSELSEDGTFEAVTSEIGTIQIRTGMTPLGDEAAVAIIQTYEDFQPQLWRMEPDGFGGTTFYSAPTPMNVMEQLSGDNWIQSWYQLLEQELAIALKLDEEVKAPQRDLNKGNNASISEGRGGGGPGGPGRGRQPGRGPTIDPPSFDPSAPG